LAPVTAVAITILITHLWGMPCHMGGCRFRPTRLACARPSFTGSSDRRSS
jgi:hypothetical protein